jgi:hypothetical protein
MLVFAPAALSPRRSTPPPATRPRCIKMQRHASSQQKRDFPLTHLTTNTDLNQGFTHRQLQNATPCYNSANASPRAGAERTHSSQCDQTRPNATSTQNANFRLPNLTPRHSPTPPPILPIAPVVDDPAFSAIRKAAPGRAAIHVNSGALRPVWRKA